jgi:hypothetical protein
MSRVFPDPAGILMDPGPVNAVPETWVMTFCGFFDTLLLLAAVITWLSKKPGAA